MARTATETKDAAPHVVLIESNTTQNSAEIEASVATAAALVGESIVEPTSPITHRTTTSTSKASTVTSMYAQAEPPSSSSAFVGQESDLENSHRGINQHKVSNAQMKEMLARFDSENAASSGTWIERGFSWWSRQRSLARQEALRREVEEQRRILAESGVQQSLTATVGGMQMEVSMDHEIDAVGTANSQGELTDSADSGNVSTTSDDNDDTKEDDIWIPDGDVQPEPNSIPFIMNKRQRQSLATQALPSGLMYYRWTRLYSLARDGDSFYTFLRKVKDSPHTVLVVRTTKGAVFGAYADSPWNIHQKQASPEFFGTGLARLFSIQGDDAKVYKWTSANEYVQFLDVSSKMVALGGGGGSFGLCIEQDFQKGSTDKCATFDNEPLCSEPSFDIVDVECYGFMTGKF